MSRSLTLALALLVTFATAATAQWTLVDSLKLGGFLSVSSLAVDSSAQLHGIGNGPTYMIYNPQTHLWHNASMPMTRSGSIKVMPNGRLIAIVDGKSLYFSDDHSSTWRKVGSNLALTTVSNVVWNDTAILAVGSGNFSGLMVLTPSDTSWVDVPATLTAHQFDGAYTTRDGYFVITQGRHVYRSRDPKQWNPNDTAAIDPKITRTLVTPNGTILAIGQFSNSIYRSSDWGKTWSTPLNLPGLTSLQTMIALKHGWVAVIDRSGFYLSTNDGTTWAPVRHLPLLYMNTLTQTAGDDLIASSQVGVYRSSDRGASWDAIDSGFAATNATALGFVGDTLFASLGFRGVYRSWKFPFEWHEVDDSLSSNIAQFQYANGKLYAASQQNLVYWNDASWSALPNLFEDRPPVTYAMSRSGRMFAATSTQFFYLAEDQSWHTVTQLFGLLVNQCVADSSGTVYARVGLDSIFYSTDDGVNWSDLPRGKIDWKIAAMSANMDTLVVATTGTSAYGVLMTSDHGASWLSLPNSLTNPIGVLGFGDRYFEYNRSSLLERRSPGLDWSSPSGLSSASQIYSMSIAASGRAFLSTTSELYTQQLPVPQRAVREVASRAELSITPNPARSLVHLDPATSGEVIDVAGRSVARFDGGTIDCSRFPAGVYQVRASDGRVARLVVVR